MTIQVISYNQKSNLYFDISLEVSLKNLLSLINEVIGSDPGQEEKPENNKNEPPKKGKNLRPFYFFLAVLLALFLLSNISLNDNEISSNMENAPENEFHTDYENPLIKDKLYRNYLWQSNCVTKEFQIEFWKYLFSNKINMVEELKEKDKKMLKEIYWKKLVETRRAFSNVEGMSELQKKVSTYYTYDRFQRDFDIFMATNNKGSFVDFERNMLEYVRAKQNDILEKIIDR